MNSSPCDGVAGKPELHLAFCGHDAARHACLNWHYSKALPAGSIVKIGVWEQGAFVGAVLFAHGSTPKIGAPYGLTQFQCIELVRVALTKHRSPVSRIIAIAIRMVKKQSPDLQLIVSYADPGEGHHGGIYQAGNWIYQGMTESNSWVKINGQPRHRRSVNSRYGTSEVAKLQQMGIVAEVIPKPGKHKYLFPLTPDMEKRLRPLHKPYPKRAPSIASDAPGVQPG